MDARLVQLTNDLHEGLAGITAQVVGLAADMAEAGPRAPTAEEGSFAIPSLIEASNQLTSNFAKVGPVLQNITDRLHDVSSRVHELEKVPATITSLQASVQALDHAVKVSLARASTAAGSAPTAPCAADAAIIEAAQDARLRAIMSEMLNANANGKHARDDAMEDSAKRLHIVPPAPLALPTAPPAPDYAAPTIAPALAPVPILALPTVGAAPVAAAFPYAAAPAVAPVTAGPAIAAAHMGPPQPPSLPRAPAGAPPRVRVDPSREVLLGPLNWEGKFNRAPHNLIMSVLGHNVMRTARFSSRRGPDEYTVIVTFEADVHAAWFITTWNDTPRMGYEICTARAASSFV
ncbi:hypothetical protein B0H14DRAFT_2670341 [Mycena olivaceomarginata]|nr:hypothetical protein B0H14DRAFT_2670341 [Mycena olivaceomarginata]